MSFLDDFIFISQQTLDIGQDRIAAVFFILKYNNSGQQGSVPSLCVDLPTEGAVRSRACLHVSPQRCRGSRPKLWRSQVGRRLTHYRLD